MELVIQPADDEHPLDKGEMETILADIRKQSVAANLRERTPPLGELASFAHLWELVASGVTGAGLIKVLQPILKVLQARQQRMLKIKLGRVSISAPASQSREELVELVERLRVASEPAPRKKKAAKAKAKAKAPQAAKRSRS